MNRAWIKAKECLWCLGDQCPLPYCFLVQETVPFPSDFVIFSQTTQEWPPSQDPLLTKLELPLALQRTEKEVARLALEHIKAKTETE